MNYYNSDIVMALLQTNEVNINQKNDKYNIH